MQATARFRNKLPLGAMGVAAAPGSTHILDRSSNTLKPCTPVTCPHAAPLPDQQCLPQVGVCLMANSLGGGLHNLSFLTSDKPEDCTPGRQRLMYAIDSASSAGLEGT